VRALADEALEGGGLRCRIRSGRLRIGIGSRFRGLWDILGEAPLVHSEIADLVDGIFAILSWLWAGTLTLKVGMFTVPVIP
jgi:hypothetical protein